MPNSSASDGLVAEGLRLSFRDADRQRFVALEIDRFAPQPGAVTAVTGPSGSGKSTLLYVLAGLLRPDAGHVRDGATDLYALSEGRRDAWRRTRVGFVFQEFHLVPELSVIANVALPATFGRNPKPRSTPEALLASLNVPTSRVSSDWLSRGERQRVAIARALLFDPPIILADEPTASLDGEASAAVRAVFRRLAGDGRTVVIASHDPEMIAAADTTIRIERGRLVRPQQRAVA